MHIKGLGVLINKNKNRCRQYYQYYSTQETVCSNARSLLLCRCYRYLQQKKSTPTGPSIREVRNEIESLQNLLPSSIPLTFCLRRGTSTRSTTRGTTSIRTPYYRSNCHRWEVSRRREPGDSIVYHRV